MDDKLYLLIVDDEDVIVEMYTQIVDESLFHVYTSNSAESAISLMKNLKFDIVVSDLRMAGSTGMEILKYINEEHLATKFIMQTGYATVDTAIQAMKEGAYDFITKPVNLLHLKALLSKCRDSILTEKENLQLRSDNVRLEELNSIKEKFIAITNHELRTPLTIIKGYTDLMGLYIDDNTDEGLRDAINTIKMTLIDMDDIVSRMHNISSFNSNKITSEHVAVDLSQIITVMLKKFEIILKERNLNLEIHSPETPVIVQADKKNIRDAISEVFQNAIKFTEDGGTITITVTDDEQNNIVKISDTGIGISEDERDKIFDVFYESQNILYHSSGGSKFMGSSLGIGLSLVKEICEESNYDYKLESEIEKGTTFTFYFPKS